MPRLVHRRASIAARTRPCRWCWVARAAGKPPGQTQLSPPSVSKRSPPCDLSSRRMLGHRNISRSYALMRQIGAGPTTRRKSSGNPSLVPLIERRAAGPCERAHVHAEVLEPPGSVPCRLIQKYLDSRRQLQRLPIRACQWILDFGFWILAGHLAKMPAWQPGQILRLRKATAWHSWRIRWLGLRR